MSLSINLATRGRSEIVLHTLEATLPNISRRDTVLLVSVDADDAKTVERVSCFALDHPQMLVSARPREDSVGEKYNRVLKLAPADVYLMMVDYAPHMTHGFDQRILDAAALFPDNIGVVYNYMANASFPGINAVTAGLAAKMGGIYPTHFPYWFVDHWLDDIARLINRIAFADVVIDTSLKQRTQEFREPVFWATFFDLGHLERRRIAHDIVRSPEFQEPPWRKAIDLAHHPLIEYRSQWVNAAVVEDTRHIISAPPDERYDRLKARAKEQAALWLAALRAVHGAMEAA